MPGSISGSAWAREKSTRRAIVTVVAVVLAGAGITLGALKAFNYGPKASVPPLNDGERFVFVPSRGAAEVTVIDSRSDQVVTRIAVAGTPNRVLVSDAAGAMAVTFADRSTLEIVGLSSPAWRAEEDFAITPEFMVMSPDGYLVAAADSRGAVSVVSLQTRKRLFRLSGFGDPRNLTFSLDGSQLYITDRETLELLVVDIVQQSVVDRLALTGDGTADVKRGKHEKDGGAGVSALTRSADGRYGFVSFAAADSLLVVDLSTMKPVKRLRVGRAPLRPYGTADGRLMLVPNDGDQSVSVVDTTTLQVVATLPGAKDVSAINTGWFESLAFVMSPSQRRVVVLDLMKFTKLGDIELPGSPGGGVVNSTGQKLYVSLVDADRVAVIDTQTRRMLAAVNGVGHQPWGATMARTNNYCH